MALEPFEKNEDLAKLLAANLWYETNEAMEKWIELMKRPENKWAYECFKSFLANAFCQAAVNRELSSMDTIAALSSSFEIQIMAKLESNEKPIVENPLAV